MASTNNLNVQPHKLLCCSLVVCLHAAATLFTSAAAVSSGASPNTHLKDTRPPLWPGAFNISIMTNITAHSKDASTAIKGVFYYDYTELQAQRVDHGSMNYECQHFYNTTSGCSLVFTADGLFRYVKNITPQCCLDMPSIQASPPDWARTSNPTYLGMEVEPVSGEVCHHWMWRNNHIRIKLAAQTKLEDDEDKQESAATDDDDDDDNDDFNEGHHYFVRTSDMRPVLFTFPAANGLQDWYFLADTMVVGAQDPERFSVATCKQSCTQW